MTYRYFTGTLGGDIITLACDHATNSYKFKWPWFTTWYPGYETLTDILAEYKQCGYIEVDLLGTPLLQSGFDPNDIQAQDAALWGSGKPCCGGGIGNIAPTYGNGKWHDNNCDSLKAPYDPIAYTLPAEKDHRPEASKKGLCTCGSAAVGSDRHSYWCDVEKK